MCNNKGKTPNNFKNNKQITIINTIVKNLFTLNISSIKDIDYNINNVDLKLWHAI